MSINAASEVIRIVSKPGKEIGLSVKGLTDAAVGKGRLAAAFSLSRKVPQEVKLVKKQDSFDQVSKELLIVSEMGENARTNVFHRQWYRAKTFASALFGKIRAALKESKPAENNPAS